MLQCIGTIGHVAHGKSTVVKAISGVQVNINMQTTSFRWKRRVDCANRDERD